MFIAYLQVMGFVYLDLRFVSFFWVQYAIDITV